ncbi:hypothetical protein BU24DRAFT_346131 [Aaosphaeria arxii CBS 175.79]|uniref:Uncharacterized protein n=1 Tax=Aaosphaeria arxii CBS 175.79 TaxID=1450172 RepID=A0A6A5XS67_9PLEO|nr:uncharacterized protein BU24DRAFT_346131 [Aaosphaeria arxii CBS 175.79]KAF2016012.1 hypothetical protein BU24DRAFT_346131 [Aaosphaeria arxii CBS 175.79]
MLVSGRGSIAQVQYTGDEAAAEIKKLLDTVVAAEDEFEHWEALVTRVSDLEGGVTRNSSPSVIELLRNVFDCFLAKFPLFFGYWKKYADLEFSIGGTETAEMVYERGISSIPVSVDLWTHYCHFKLDTCHDNDIIRDLFERGTHFVGMDFQSGPFWDKYIEFEERINEASNVTKLYARVFQIPSFNFGRYYEKFRARIGIQPVEELVEPEVLVKMTSDVRSEEPGLPELEVERSLRTKIDAHYYQAYTLVQNESTKRWTFESNIKRGYFHVTEVEEADLANWRKYLEFEESEGDFKRVAFLYERCLVSCALYDEFWLRYARWMFGQSKGDEFCEKRDEDTRLIYMRASCIFVPIDRPTIRLHWARFEEKLERTQVARDIHSAILDQVPNHVETLVSFAGLERRQTGNEAAIELLGTYIEQRDIEISSQLLAEQARILWQCSNDAARARQLFKDNYEKFVSSQAFWINYLKFEISQPFQGEDEAHTRIKAVHDLMRSKAQLSPEALKDLSSYYMEYLLDRGGKEAAHEYMLLDRGVNGYVASTPDVPSPLLPLPKSS